MSKRTIADMRKVLVDDYGYDAEKVAEMRKSDITKILDELELDNIMDTLEIEEDTSPIVESSDEVPAIHQNNDANTQENIGPSITSAEWTPFVIKQLLDNEMDRGMPRVDGLRRIARKLLGPFNSYTSVLQCPDKGNGERATVHVRISFWGSSMGDYDGVADVCIKNTEKTYAIHPVATAETRAEGRALRKALMLGSILTAEELSLANTENDEDTDLADVKAPESMINTLLHMSNSLGIDAHKLVVAKVQPDIENIKTLSVMQARKVCELINEYRTNPQEIPDNVKS